MNYQDYIKYDPEKKQYTDSYGYVIDGYTSKALPSEQRAQQPVKVNKVALIDTDSGVDPIVQAVGSDSTNLILDAKGSVKTTKSLVVGSSNTNKYISVMGDGTTKITTTQGTNADCDLTLEWKGTGKLILTSQNTSSTRKESLDLSVYDGVSTFTAASLLPATYPNSDIKFVPRGLGIVDCKSGTAEWNRGIGSGQTLAAGNNKVWFDNLIHSSFTYGFVTYTDIGGSKYDTFTNASGRAIVLLVTGHIRETTTVAGRTLNLWIARTGDSTLQYGQAMLSSNGADHNDKRALNSTAIIRLANNESFSLWAYTNDTGIVIGGANELAARPILSYRLMP